MTFPLTCCTDRNCFLPAMKGRSPQDEAGPDISSNHMKHGHTRDSDHGPMTGQLLHLVALNGSTQTNRTTPGQRSGAAHSGQLLIHIALLHQSAAHAHPSFPQSQPLQVGSFMTIMKGIVEGLPYGRRGNLVCIGISLANFLLLQRACLPQLRTRPFLPPSQPPPSLPTV